MTLIINPDLFKSKAAVKTLLDAGTTLREPTPWGDKFHDSKTLPVGYTEVVTNHPLRTKFAKISKTASGWKVS